MEAERRGDDPAIDAGPTAPATGARPAPTKRLRWAAVAGLTALIAVTSIAVARVNAWLVPPYLLLMGWILLGPRGGSRPGAAAGEEGPAFEARPAPESEPDALIVAGTIGPAEAPAAPPKQGLFGRRRRVDPPRADAIPEPSTPAPEEARPSAVRGWFARKRASAALHEDGQGDAAQAEARADAEPEPEPEPADGAAPAPTTKARRKRRKKAEPAPEAPPTEVAWVRVGPNQFVRQETPIDPPALDGSPTADEPPADPSAPAGAAPPVEPHGSGSPNEGTSAGGGAAALLGAPGSATVPPWPSPGMPPAPGAASAEEDTADADAGFRESSGPIEAHEAEAPRWGDPRVAASDPDGWDSDPEGSLDDPDERGPLDAADRRDNPGGWGEDPDGDDDLDDRLAPEGSPSGHAGWEVPEEDAQPQGDDERARPGIEDDGEAVEDSGPVAYGTANDEGQDYGDEGQDYGDEDDEDPDEDGPDDEDPDGYDDADPDDYGDDSAEGDAHDPRSSDRGAEGRDRTRWDEDGPAEAFDEPDAIGPDDEYGDGEDWDEEDEEDRWGASAAELAESIVGEAHRPPDPPPQHAPPQASILPEQGGVVGYGQDLQSYLQDLINMAGGLGVTAAPAPPPRMAPLRQERPLAPEPSGPEIPSPREPEAASAEGDRGSSGDDEDDAAGFAPPEPIGERPEPEGAAPVPPGAEDDDEPPPGSRRSPEHPAAASCVGDDGGGPDGAEEPASAASGSAHSPEPEPPDGPGPGAPYEHHDGSTCEPGPHAPTVVGAPGPASGWEQPDADAGGSGSAVHGASPAAEIASAFPLLRPGTRLELTRPMPRAAATERRSPLASHRRFEPPKGGPRRGRPPRHRHRYLPRAPPMGPRPRPAKPGGTLTAFSAGRMARSARPRPGPDRGRAPRRSAAIGATRRHAGPGRDPGPASIRRSAGRPFGSVRHRAASPGPRESRGGRPIRMTGGASPGPMPTRRVDSGSERVRRPAGRTTRPREDAP